MLERVQNKFIRYLYLKLYRKYLFFPLMYPLFVLGMYGYNVLRERRKYALPAYVVKLLRGIEEHSLGVVGRLKLWVPDR